MLISELFINQLFSAKQPQDFHSYYRAWSNLLTRLFTSTEGYTVTPADFRLPSFRDHKIRKGGRKERGWSVEVNHIPLLYCDVNLPDAYYSAAEREAVYLRIEEIARTIPFDFPHPLRVIAAFGRKFVLFRVDRSSASYNSGTVAYTISNYVFVSPPQELPRGQAPTVQAPKEWDAVDLTSPGFTQLYKLLADINEIRPAWNHLYDSDSDCDDVA